MIFLLFYAFLFYAFFVVLCFFLLFYAFFFIGVVTLPGDILLPRAATPLGDGAPLGAGVTHRLATSYEGQYV